MNFIVQKYLHAASSSPFSYCIFFNAMRFLILINSYVSMTDRQDGRPVLTTIIYNNNLNLIQSPQKHSRPTSPFDLERVRIALVEQCSRGKEEEVRVIDDTLDAKYEDTAPRIQQDLQLSKSSTTSDETPTTQNLNEEESIGSEAVKYWKRVKENTSKQTFNPHVVEW